MNAFFVFVIGLFWGSFLNVVLFRYPKFAGLFWGRSCCPKCRQSLAIRDLIPVLSYMILGGRCRNCRGKISVQYPLIELATGALFLLDYYLYGFSIIFAVYALIFSLSLLVFVYDLKYLEIPEIFSWVFLALTIVVAPFTAGFNLTDFLLGGLIGGGVLGILVGISDEKWMGSGDIKIGLGFGFLLGYPQALLFLFLAFVTGALFGLALILLKKGKLKTQLPFAPFLITGALITLVIGQRLIDFYLNFAML